MDLETNPDSPAAAPSAASEPAPDVSGKTPPPDPSPGKDAEKATLLDAVRSAIDPKNIEGSAPEEKPADSPADPSPAEGAKSPDPEAKPNGKDKDDVSDTALLAALDQLKSDVPLNKIERFREVLSENRQLKAANDRYTELDKTLTDIGNDAARMGLTNDELAQLFAWPRLLAKDPKAAVEQLSQFSSRWQERVGHSLPTDLRQKVDDGQMDEATAKEVAQLRASKALTETRQAADDKLRQQDESTRKRKEISDAVNAYQAELRRTDPDYTPDKNAMVAEALTSLATLRGVPQDVMTARAMAKEAFDTVTARLAKLRPAPRAVSSPVGRRTNSPAVAEPKSMREAIERTLGV